MSKFAYMLNEQSLTMLFSNGDVEVMPIERAKSVIDAINERAGEDEIRKLVDKAKVICNYMDDTIVVQNGVVLYKGEPVNNVIVEKILDFQEKGYPYKPLLAFLARIMENPSRRAIHELYGFLDQEHLGITDAGTFLAYKAVRENWTDKYSGKFDNHVGNTLEMPRNSVDDDCRIGCSYGFHVGSLKYVTGFKDSSDHVLIVEVDPKDVVSVPTEDCGKVRVCKYKVVGEYTGPLPGYCPGYTDTPDPDDPEDDEDDEDDEPSWEPHGEDGEPEDDGI